MPVFGTSSAIPYALPPADLIPASFQPSSLRQELFGAKRLTSATRHQVARRL